MAYLLKESTKQTLSPYPFQQEAIHALLKTLKTHDRTHIVMACGTGKSLVGLWLSVSTNRKASVLPVNSILKIFSSHLKDYPSYRAD